MPIDTSSRRPSRATGSRLSYLLLCVTFAGCAADVAQPATGSPGYGPEDLARGDAIDRADSHDDPDFAARYVLNDGSGERSGDTIQRPWKVRLYKPMAFESDEGATIGSAWYQQGKEVAFDDIDPNQSACQVSVARAKSTRSRRELTWRMFPFDGPTWRTTVQADVEATDWIWIHYAYAHEGNIVSLRLWSTNEAGLRTIDCRGPTASLADVAAAFNDVRTGWRVAFRREAFDEALPGGESDSPDDADSMGEGATVDDGAPAGEGDPAEEGDAP